MHLFTWKSFNFYAKYLQSESAALWMLLYYDGFFLLSVIIVTPIIVITVIIIVNIIIISIITQVNLLIEKIVF